MPIIASVTELNNICFVFKIFNLVRSLATLIVSAIHQSNLNIAILIFRKISRVFHWTGTAIYRDLPSDIKKDLVRGSRQLNAVSHYQNGSATHYKHRHNKRTAHTVAHSAETNSKPELTTTRDSVCRPTRDERWIRLLFYAEC